jgi:hypothetical protein
MFEIDMVMGALFRSFGFAFASREKVVSYIDAKRRPWQ